MIFVDRSTITPEVRRAYAMMQIRDLFKISIFYNKTCLVDCCFYRLENLVCNKALIY